MHNQISNMLMIGLVIINLHQLIESKLISYDCIQDNNEQDGIMMINDDCLIPNKPRKLASDSRPGQPKGRNANRGEAGTTQLKIKNWAKEFNSKPPCYQPSEPIEFVYSIIGNYDISVLKSKYLGTNGGGVPGINDFHPNQAFHMIRVATDKTIYGGYTIDKNASVANGGKFITAFGNSDYTVLQIQVECLKENGLQIYRLCENQTPLLGGTHVNKVQFDEDVFRENVTGFSIPMDCIVRSAKTIDELDAMLSSSPGPHRFRKQAKPQESLPQEQFELQMGDGEEDLPVPKEDSVLQKVGELCYSTSECERPADLKIAIRCCPIPKGVGNFDVLDPKKICCIGVKCNNISPYGCQ